MKKLMRNSLFKDLYIWYKTTDIFWGKFVLFNSVTIRIHLIRSFLSIHYYFDDKWYDIIIALSRLKYSVISYDAAANYKVRINLSYAGTLTITSTLCTSVCTHMFILCYVVVMLSIYHKLMWFIYPYSSGLLDWRRGNLLPVPVK